MVRALTGETGGYPLSDSLQKHPTHGRLSFLGTKKTDCIIDTLIKEEALIERQAKFNGTVYTILVPADSATGE